MQWSGDVVLLQDQEHAVREEGHGIHWLGHGGSGTSVPRHLSEFKLILTPRSSAIGSPDGWHVGGLQEVPPDLWHPRHGDPRRYSPRADDRSRSRLGMVALRSVAGHLDLDRKSCPFIAISLLSNLKANNGTSQIAPYLIWRAWSIRDTMGWRTQTIGCCLSKYGFPSSLALKSMFPVLTVGDVPVCMRRRCSSSLRTSLRSTR